MRVAFLLSFILLTVALLVYFYIKNPRQVIVFIKTMRLSRHLYYTFIFVSGFLLGQKISGASFSFFFFISGLFLINLLFFASLILNNIYDKNIDAINLKDNTLNSRAVTSRGYLHLLYVLTALSLIFSLFISFKVLCITLLIIFFSFIYSAPPLRLKKVFLINTLLIALSTLLALFLGYGATPALFSLFPVKLGTTILLVLLLAFNTKDVNDFKGDKKHGIKTIMTVFGPAKGKTITSVLAFAGYLLVPVLLNTYLLLIPSAICGALTYSIISVRASKINETAVFIIFFIYGALFLFINPIR